MFPCFVGFVMKGNTTSSEYVDRALVLTLRSETQSQHFFTTTDETDLPQSLENLRRSISAKEETAKRRAKKD